MEPVATLSLRVHLVLFLLVQHSVNYIGAAEIQPWPQRLIPYKFSDELTWLQKYRIKNAIADVNKNSCASFVPWYSEDAYVEFGVGINCENPYGKQFNGKHRVLLFATVPSRDNERCGRSDSIRHELIKVAGGNTTEDLVNLYQC